MTDDRILKRSEVKKENTWATEDMFPSDQAWSEEYEALKALPAQAAALKGTLGRSAGDLLRYFKEYDRAGYRLHMLGNYASRKSDEDTGNGFYQDMRNKAMSLAVAVESAGAYATPEILAIPDQVLEGFFAQEPALETYRRPIEKIRRKKEHTLSPAEEALLAAAGEIAEAPGSIGSVFRNADLHFPPVQDAGGASHPLTQESLVAYLRSTDRVLRKNAFDTFYTTLYSWRNSTAAMLDAQFRQLKFFADARHYNSTLEAALDQTEVPVQVYHSLIEAVHNNMDKMYRYMALRKKRMGLEELHMYDLYPPIVTEASAEIPFERAKETVLEALSVLGEDYTAILKEGFENRWIDVYENEGKRGGAYSAGGFPHPYVLLNHKNDLGSQFTLAHEMGHSLHSYYSCKNQPLCTANYVIFVAEVASTCNEVLMIHHLLNKTTEKAQRAYLVNHFLEKFRTTLYRQTMFAEFELFMGRACEAGQTLTADVLCQEYHRLNRLYYGDNAVIDDGIAMEWARIPHFYYNYYVFQYATGFSAAIAIAMRILKEGAPAVADYKKFLSSGGSQDPISLLKIAGVDMSSPKPVEQALEMFGQLLDEMEQLTN
ncbi:MAG: oligoendopeptidase F [Clostridia bacterium]|nr:oligoendopeptidase F [Clostridia bacterium]